jgi:hypothetical protein
LSNRLDKFLLERAYGLPRRCPRDPGPHGIFLLASLATHPYWEIPRSEICARWPCRRAFCFLDRALDPKTAGRSAAARVSNDNNFGWLHTGRNPRGHEHRRPIG